MAIAKGFATVAMAIALIQITPTPTARAGRTLQLVRLVDRAGPT